jgi:NAD(P)-dependent dehydrogenase (short-subunit alcohol dehydrogenase family)
VLFAAHGASVPSPTSISKAPPKPRVSSSSRAAALAVRADVSRAHDCEAMVRATVDYFGLLDILYNNAAVQMSGRLVDCTEDDWDVTIATNLSAIFWACRAALPHMLGREGGSIINTASTLGLIGSEGYAAYGAAKAGLVALTRQIAVDDGPMVRANVIAPGSIDTPRFRKVTAALDDPVEFLRMLMANVPARRLGTAGDVAEIALFLASDRAGYTSGAVIPCDGGLAAVR